VLSSVKIHVVPAHAFGSQANFSAATQTIHHSEDLIPRSTRATVEKLVQQKTGLIGKHSEYSMSEITLLSHISHGDAPFRSKDEPHGVEKLIPWNISRRSPLPAPKRNTAASCAMLLELLRPDAIER
jgi:hypothetical protein